MGDMAAGLGTSLPEPEPRGAEMSGLRWLCPGGRPSHPPGGPNARVLPVLAFLQEKGLRGRDCVYLTPKGKCISAKRLTCKNGLEMGFLARGQRLLGVMNINFQRT